MFTEFSKNVLGSLENETKHIKDSINKVNLYEKVSKTIGKWIDLYNKLSDSE